MKPLYLSRRPGILRFASTLPALLAGGLLLDPNAERTPLNGNKLWQLATLEMWLQAQGIPA